MNKSVFAFAIFISVLGFVGCTTTVKKDSNAKWKVLNKSPNIKETEAQVRSTFVPSGTELVFTDSKVFNEKNNYINIALAPDKRCSLSISLDKMKEETTLSPNTILTVVGYRGETGELVLSESSYQQYFISCLSLNNTEQKRKTSSVKNKVAKGMEWKKTNIEIDDIKKMSPLLKVKFIPQ